MPRTRRPRVPRARRRVPRMPKTQTKAVTAIVKKVMSRNSETKVVNYYSNQAGFAGDGTWAARALSIQNQNISNTVTDLKRLYPFVVQGIADNQRIGESIQPVSLTIQGQVGIRRSLQEGQLPVDIFCVIYVLEHVIYKDYTSLITGNNFSQLLTIGQNNTVSFAGEVWHSQLAVANQFYRLLKKKVIRLRYAGVYGGGNPGTALLSVANSHDYQAKFNLNFSQKQLPKSLKYPEQNGIAGQNDPTNHAPFFCMGFYYADGEVATGDVDALQQQYTSILKYKDI